MGALSLLSCKPPGTDGEVTKDTSKPLPWSFRYGLNMGHRNATWGDDKEATLGSRAGARSIRVKLPAAHLKTWGYDIEKGDVATYASLDMTNHIGFLIGSETLALSTAPAGSADWQNEWFIPKNLYEPVLGTDGNINPDNYWGAYVFKVVSAYKSDIKVWHLWNEPDWVSDWHVVGNWKTNAPKASELPRFNGSIYDYVRMLRVAKIAASKADPDSMIATGGIGYPNFLDAILRYTDNPADGSVTAEYPQKGGDFVDVIDFHYYPIFSAKGSDASVDDFIASKNALNDVLVARGVKVRGWNNSENGAPAATTPDYPNIGSNEYARNYLIKLMVMAQANDIGGVDWFILSDGSDTNVFSHMGLYEDVGSLSSVDDAVKTDSGKAYAALAAQLGTAKFDADATNALSLPSGVRGAAFLKDGKRRLVLWAATSGTSETASANFTLPAGNFTRASWDGTAQGSVSGAVTLSGSPEFFVEQ